MADIMINSAKLEAKKKDLKYIKNDVLHVLNLMKKYFDQVGSYWEGPKAEEFIEETNKFWNGGKSSNSAPIIDCIELDFLNLIDFIDKAIKDTNATDVKVEESLEIDGAQSGSTGNTRNDNVPETTAAVGAGVATTAAAAENDEKVDVAPPSNSSSNSGNITYLEGTNYEIDTSVPCAQGTQYSLSEEEIKKLAYVAKNEQGSVAGAKIELSLMANLYETSRGKNYDSIYDYVGWDGWFHDEKTKDNAYVGYSEPPQEYIDAVNDVLVDGNRYLPTNVVEHDCARNIVSVKVNGEEINKNDRHLYVPYETVIENEWGAKYTFVGFAPTTEWDVKGDPFGYM